VYEQWRGSARTIANRYLPLEIPQEFPSRRGQAIAYTHCCALAFYAILITLASKSSIKYTLSNSDLIV
jgi:hypothetical protein